MPYVHSNKDPRACVLISSDIEHKFTLVQKFFNSNNIILYCPTSSLYVFLLPMYLATYDSLKQELKPIESFLTSIKLMHFIWGLGSNSKHNLWYSPLTDVRGKMQVES